jgi:hypothetical protein
MCKRLIYLVSLVFVLGPVSSASAELVAHWTFDEGTGDTAFDSSGNEYHATLVGNPAWVPGRLGGAINLENGGYGGILGLSYEGSGFLGLTVCTWVRTSSAGAQFVASFDRNEYWRLAVGSTNANVSAGQVGWHVMTDAGQIDYGSDKLVDDGEWHHICGVYDNGTATIYIDGEPEPSRTQGNTWGSGNLRYGYIGKNSEASAENQAGPGGTPVAGDIDDMRIYDNALSEPEILAVMKGGSGGYPYALGPEPADGSFFENTWGNLSWRAGDSAVSHDVYMGENFDDVNNGTGDTFVGNQSTTDITVGFPGFPFPDGLVPGTTYYWRIDEVNETEPNSPWKGDVWSFTVPPRTAYLPVPADGGESVAVDAQLTWAPGFSAKLHTVYFGDNFDDVSNAAGGPLLGDPFFTPPGPLELAKTYYWRVDEFDPPFTHKGEVWSFTTEGTAANPYPAKGAVDTSPTPILTWTAASLVASHEVYFGADAEAVANADKTSPEHKGTRALGEETYDAGRLELLTTYYWRIDEVNDTQPGSPWIGNVWSFTTGDFLVVDDFESYNDIDPPDEASNRIFDKWIDGFGTTTNGALVGNDLPPYAEQGIVHGASQSMIYRYDNAGKTSEATLTLVYPRDWTEEGVTKLSLWFRGNSTNAAERMFVALNPGTPGVVYHSDPAATQTTRWTEWVIDLTEFAGVDLTNVNTITIGFGTRGSPAASGGTGTMHFDDIRLYR